MSGAKHTPGPWVWGSRLSGSENHRGFNICGTRGGWNLALVQPGDQDGQLGEANARLIAAAPELLSALEWREQFEPRAGEGDNERFERIAENFRRETGHLRPGKDCMVESYEVRQQAWDEWMEAGRARVRAAIAKATGSAQ